MTSLRKISGLITSPATSSTATSVATPSATATTTTTITTTAVDIATTYSIHEAAARLLIMLQVVLTLIAIEYIPCCCLVAVLNCGRLD